MVFVRRAPARFGCSPFETTRIRLEPTLVVLALYVLVTAILGRDVIASLATGILNDAGDPLLNAAILSWSATHVPLSHAWWQFPIYHPASDALAFSEHLLGVSVLATPLHWLTGDALVTYNLSALLTFPLSALAMYALAFTLTQSVAGAFVAGLAFAFAPYRMAQLPHIQVLASFWAPLALLALHRFLESRRRRHLVLYGVTWLLQGAANGYALIFFSVFVGLWTFWFVILARRWRDLMAIAAATLVASLPLLPVLYKYVDVRERYGFLRSVDEIRIYSADLAAVLCATSNLTFWGWIRAQCGPEGELFPGVALFCLFVGGIIVGVVWIRRQRSSAAPPGPVLVRARQALIAIGLLYALVLVSILLSGGWRLDLGPVHVSATRATTSFLMCLVAFGTVLLVSLRRHATGCRSSALWFYIAAAVVMWLLALGPTISLMGTPTPFGGPYEWLLRLPGVNGLRVPARTWLFTILSLSVVAAFVVGHLFRRLAPRRAMAALAIVLLSAAVLADGWIGRIAVQPAPPPVPGASVLADKIVMELPLGDTYRDIAALWRAVVGGWRTVNGLSGYAPSGYGALVQAAKIGSDELFRPFVDHHDLHVVVFDGNPRLDALVGRQPGAELVARSQEARLYRIPRRATSGP
jgi:hypothetical protein